jgi:O-antigen biosynthesis protein
MTFEADFYALFATWIAEAIRPHTVLAVSGAEPLFDQLQARGITADRLTGAPRDPLAQRYDLIVCLDALEYLSASETERTLANLCHSTADLLLFSAAFEPATAWATCLAKLGFFHDLDEEIPAGITGVLRFRRSRDEAIGLVVAAYERRVWQLTRESTARRELNLEQRDELAVREDMIRTMRDKADRYDEVAQALEVQNARLRQLDASLGGKLLRGMQGLRARIAPPRSQRDQMLEKLIQRVVIRGRLAPGSATRLVQVEPVVERPPLAAHEVPVDILVCVHNALDDVQRCLASVMQFTTPPYTLILVDDGSEAPARDFLREFTAQHDAILIRNEVARGFACASNQGLRQSRSAYVINLNSDTIVTPQWIDRLIACAASDDRIGVFGPLSNTASWQSIPAIEDQGDWAANPLPEGVTVEQMGQWVARYSARLYPALPFLNGFCYGIKHTVLEWIGYLDEENFGPGYGEEDDFTLRARQAGFRVAIADDAYVYHAQSRSYSNEKRHLLSEQAGRRLADKHGQELINVGVAACQSDAVMLGIRARSRVMREREALIQQGHDRFAGRRLLFVLPIAEPGGGGNVVIDEALLMRRMGVEICLFNLADHQARFERAYPRLEIPVIYGTYDQLPALSAGFDAVIATFNASVEALVPLTQQEQPPVLGYYIQGFEPYMYTPGTPEYQRALQSYTLIPELRLFTKTDWTRQEVAKHTGAACVPIGISLNIDLFRPRPPIDPAWPARPVRVAAMIRPAAPYREPKLTLELLRQAVRRNGAQVEAVIFGVAENDPAFYGLPRDFAYTSAGVLNQKQVARLLNEVDVFVDFSSHQAMGLTALEAMACGAAVIVPAQGGATSFAQHGENSLVVDTTSRRACATALRQLVDDHDLRRRLQQQALQDVSTFFPERSAFHLLGILFGGQPA